jgi:hypothetical protein
MVDLVEVWYDQGKRTGQNDRGERVEDGSKRIEDRGKRTED